MDSGLFTGLCHNHSERYGPRLDNFLLGTSNRSFQLFDKSKTTVPGQPFSSRPHNSQPARHVGDARRGPGQRWCNHDVSSDFVPSDLDDIQFHWENPNIDMDAVYRPGIDTPFSPSLFENIPVAGSADYPIEIDDEQDNENEYPTTPESQRPLQPPPRHRSLSRPFGTRLENIPNSVYRSLFE